jgi:hypothetical protein
MLSAFFGGWEKLARYEMEEGHVRSGSHARVIAAFMRLIHEDIRKA